MDSFHGIVSLKLETAHDRIESLLAECEELGRKTYSSPGSSAVLHFVQESAFHLRDLLSEEAALSNAGLLQPRETEVRVHRGTQLLPLLHQLLGFIAGSDINAAPGQLIPPLRRYSRKVIPEAELVVSSKPELNYSINEISEPLRSMLKGTLLEPGCKKLPKYLFVITIPAVESEHILIHATLSHELGHGLYVHHRLPDSLLPLLKVRENLIQKLVSTATGGQAPPHVELVVRQKITEGITERVTNWVMELCSDSFGVRLFGPAFYFAFTHFLLSFSHLDHSSKSHPPSRLRLKLMGRLLRELYPDIGAMDPKLAEFFRSWEEAAAGEILFRSMADEVAVALINTDNILDAINGATDLGGSVGTYSMQKFESDVKEMGPLFTNLVPAGEIGVLGSEMPASIASIINVGWYVYICRLDEFRSKLPSASRESRLRTSARLQELVLKALEISETRVRWKEALDDIERRQNTRVAGEAVS